MAANRIVSPAERVAATIARLRDADITGAAQWVELSTAITSLRRTAERSINDAVNHERVKDPRFDSLLCLCVNMAEWSAAYYASPELKTAARYRGNPTDAGGRLWFRSRKWHPFLDRLARLALEVGGDALIERAHQVLLDLESHRLDMDDALLPDRLLGLLGSGRLPKAKRGRPRLTLEQRAERVASAARAAERGPGQTRGVWFNRSLLCAYGIGNPADVWSAAMRSALRDQGVETRLWPRRAGRQRWQLRVIHREIKT